MKKISRFMKDTRGVVMMEYIILGLFAVAVTLVAVATLGKTYNKGLLAMSYATAGESAAVTTVAKDMKSVPEAAEDAISEYAQSLTTAATSSWQITYDSNNKPVVTPIY